MAARIPPPPPPPPSPHLDHPSSPSASAPLHQSSTGQSTACRRLPSLPVSPLLLPSTLAQPAQGAHALSKPARATLPVLLPPCPPHPGPRDSAINPQWGPAQRPSPCSCVPGPVPVPLIFVKVTLHTIPRRRPCHLVLVNASRQVCVTFSVYNTSLATSPRLRRLSVHERATGTLSRLPQHQKYPPNPLSAHDHNAKSQPTTTSSTHMLS